jgi:hypothetical protein
VVGNPIDRHLSSQILDSLLSVLSIVRSTNFQDQHTILVRVAANSTEAEIRSWLPLCLPLSCWRTADRAVVADDGCGVTFCSALRLPTSRCMACGIATLEDSIGSPQKEERSWSERYVTFGEDRSVAFLVATFPF